MKTEILSTSSPAGFSLSIKRAAELLRAGEVVALPTETVYGLAANALDPAAVGKIYAIKGRPSHNPIIIHVSDIAMARECVAVWTDAAEALSKSFWPGPLTIVLPRAKSIPEIVTAGGETVGLRCPSHPVMQAVIRECGFPLAAPSANLSNAISPTCAAHVARQLDGRLPLILDGGESRVGIESTVVDLASTTPRVLRPGMIHDESIARVLGLKNLDESSIEDSNTLRSPGMLRKHYSPRARLVILNWRDDDDLKKLIGTNAARVHVICHSRIPSSESFARVSVLPRETEAFARLIYAELHRCDEAGADVIAVESLPESPEWRGIKDRLTRASAD